MKASKCAVAALAAAPLAVHGQADNAANAAQLAKELQNPIANLTTAVRTGACASSSPCCFRSEPWIHQRNVAPNAGPVNRTFWMIGRSLNR
jgi:hypothetical protein